jgi:hypothetical protein
MESINDIAIKLSVDAEGVSRGFRTAAEETRAYQKELERLVYAVGKNDPVDYNAHVTQYTQATEARLAKEKKAQEEFNAWYRAEADKEFQAWYAVELKKENVRQQQLAQERQSAINTVNAQNFQAVPEAETLGRAITNDKLEEAIKARYALLDQEERALRENAANNAATIQRANAEVQRLHQQDLDNLREYITQKYAILNREEAIEKMNASNAAEIARMRTLQSQQAAARANAQRDSDFAAYKADLARQEAAGMLNAERTARIERARQRDAKRAADDDRVRQLNDWRMQQALMQRAAIDTQLTVTRMGGGFGGAAMAMGQASYAAEDFAQVLSMGGGLNMALMSASNNLSMVVRALLGTSGAMAALAGVAVPAVLIATGMFIRHLMEEEQQAKSTADALRDIRDAYDEVREAARRASQQRRLLRDIQNQTSVQGIENDRIEQQDRLNDLLEEQKTLEEELAALRNQAAHAGGLGVPLDMLLEDIRRQMESGEGHVGDTEALILQEQQRLRTAYENMQLAIEVGNEGDIILAARAYRDVLEDHVALFGLVGEGATKSALASVNGLLAQEDALKLLIEAMKEQKVAAEQIADAEKALADIETKRIRLMEEAAQKERQRMQLLQDNIRFQLEANDAQKEAADIQNQLAQFLGVDNPNPMQGLDPNDMSAEQARQSAEFLELMWRNLDRQKKEILDEKQRVTPVGGLEQNTFQAQADAFRQVLEATNREEDPQLTRLIRLQETANDLLEDITGIRIVQ